MSRERIYKYSCIVAVFGVFWLLGSINERALGLEPTDLRVFAPIIFMFFFLAGPVVYLVVQFAPYALILSAFLLPLLWWFERDGQPWSGWRGYVMIAGGTSALSLLFGIGTPLFVSIASALILFVYRRTAGHPPARWIDMFGKTELIWLAIAFVAFMPDLSVNRLFYAEAPRPSTEQVPAYQTRYDREMTPAAIRAAASFPHPRSCLVDEHRHLPPHEAMLIDWSMIKTTAEAEVCIFRVMSARGGIDVARPFIEAQGFSMNEQSFSPENPYLHRKDGALRIDAHWSIRKHGPKFPKHGIFTRIGASVSYSMYVNVFFSPDGEQVQSVNIGYNTL